MFGKLSDAEVSQKAGRLRNDTDYEAALIEQLKNNRLGLFPKYTNPELTYEDIARPWRNLTTSVWGEAADETQGLVARNGWRQMILLLVQHKLHLEDKRIRARGDHQVTHRSNRSIAIKR